MQHILRAIERGQHQHRHEPVRLAQLAGDVEAIDAGQHDIQDHDVRVRAVAQQVLERRFAIVEHGDLVAFGFEIEAQPLRQVRLVLDDQDLAHRA